MSRVRAQAALVLVGLLVTGCASAPALPEALTWWRGGMQGRALTAARAEVERFREGNHLTSAEIEAALGDLDRRFDDGLVLVLPDDIMHDVHDDPGGDMHPVHEPFERRDAAELTLRNDLASLGAARVLRAVRSVHRLALARFAPGLMAIIWRREAYRVDGPLLTEASPALRSVTVKAAALRALEALR